MVAGKEPTHGFLSFIMIIPGSLLACHLPLHVGYHQALFLELVSILSLSSAARRRRSHPWRKSLQSTSCWICVCEPERVVSSPVNETERERPSYVTSPTKWHDPVQFSPSYAKKDLTKQTLLSQCAGHRLESCPYSFTRLDTHNVLPPFSFQIACPYLVFLWPDYISCRLGSSFGPSQSPFFSYPYGTFINKYTSVMIMSFWLLILIILFILFYFLKLYLTARLSQRPIDTC